MFVVLSFVAARPVDCAISVPSDCFSVRVLLTLNEAESKFVLDIITCAVVVAIAFLLYTLYSYMVKWIFTKCDTRVLLGYY